MDVPGFRVHKIEGGTGARIERLTVVGAAEGGPQTEHDAPGQIDANDGGRQDTVFDLVHLHPQKERQHTEESQPEDHRGFFEAPRQQRDRRQRVAIDHDAQDAVEPDWPRRDPLRLVLSSEQRVEAAHQTGTNQVCRPKTEEPEAPEADGRDAEVEELQPLPPDDVEDPHQNDGTQQAGRREPEGTVGIFEGPFDIIDQDIEVSRGFISHLVLS